MRHLVWFRSDLRVLDNTALHEACRDPQAEVIALFVATPAQWRRHDMALVRERFLARNLACLSASLAALGIPLLYREVADFRAVPAVLARCTQELHCDAVFMNREYAVNERQRDTAATAVLAALGVPCHGFHDFTILPPGLLTQGGKSYTVFTPYRHAWLQRYRLVTPGVMPLPAKRHKKPAGISADPVPVPQAHPMDRLWPAGEDAAQSRLRDFAQHRLQDYQRHRDRPGIDGTSALSPYLAAGVISPRVCLEAALSANRGRIDGGSEGVTTWIHELVWRDFYTHILDSFPQVSRHQAFRTETERVPWRDDAAGFAAWCEGRTGFPLVDAAMRQLVQTGWMHNRLRMLTAMFLSKHLLIDWRQGERFFMQHLVDGDLAANNGGWQWAASTGTDAVPYFRLFNPISQSRKFDPDGDFIRRFVPELQALDARDIHDPPDPLRLALAYPARAVDLVMARKRALAAFQSTRQGEQDD